MNPPPTLNSPPRPRFQVGTFNKKGHQFPPERKHWSERVNTRGRKAGIGHYLNGRLCKHTKSKNIKSYQRATKCAMHLIQQDDGRLCQMYCKSRSCFVCNGIRTASLIDEYQPIVEGWDDLFMTTLTVPNVRPDQLRSEYKRMVHCIRLIVRDMNKKGHQCQMIRTTEVTINEERGDVHPHFHILVDSEFSAEWIKAEWIRRLPEVSGSAQDVRKADNGSLLQMFKYLTKLLPTMKKTPSDRYVYLLDRVLSEMKSAKLVQRYGFTLPDKSDDEVFDELENAIRLPEGKGSEGTIWTLHPKLGYVDYDTGELLTDDYEPPPFLTCSEDGSPPPKGG